MKLADQLAGRLDLALRKIGVYKRESFGLRGLDHKLNEYVHFRNGTFIEAGANNGIDQSNTFFFEKYLGWKGLLIEPIPRLADLCRRNRPKTAVEACALVPFDFPDREITITYCNLMSIVSGAQSPAALKRHLESGRQFLHDNDPTHEIRVPACPLSSLIEKTGLEKIDLLSLDVEGFEIEALRGLDFTRHAPTWMLIEALNPDRILALVGEQYQFVTSLSEGDQLFRRK